MTLFHAKRIDSVLARLTDPLACFLDALRHFRPNARLRHDPTISISDCAPQESIDGGNTGDFSFHPLPQFRHGAFPSPLSEQPDRPRILGYD
jgi:hypothetical protein